MLDKEASKEQAWAEKLWGSTEFMNLRKQMEEDYGYYGPKEFTMSKIKGDWDSITSPTARTKANKMISQLSASTMQLYIDADVDNLEKKEREQIAQTERAGNGFLVQVDRDNVMIPNGKRTQQALSAFAVLRGGTVMGAYWYKDKDEAGKPTGKPHPMLPIYDAFGCAWKVDDKGLRKFVYRESITEEDAEETYGKKKGLWDKIKSLFSSSTTSKVIQWTIFDRDEWKSIINNEYVDGDEHDLGYVPVFVNSCGAVPVMQTETWDAQGMLKYSWQSFAVNIRSLFDLESKLLSIGSTKAIESGQVIIQGKFNSNGGNIPPTFEKSENRRQVLWFDTAKGEEPGQMIAPQDNRVIDAFLPQVVDRENAGTMDPITQGVMSQAGSGALAQLLDQAAREFMNAFRECVEGSLAWGAYELVKQYKTGDFGEIQVNGRDRRKNTFDTKISPKEVVDDKPFTCNLVADKLRDKMQNIGALIQAVDKGVLSLGTGLTMFDVVDDPDRELEKIKQERAAKIAETDPLNYYDTLALYHKDQGNNRLALYYQWKSESLIKQAEQEMAASNGNPVLPVAPENLGGAPPTVTPQMQAEQIMNQPLVGQ